MPHYEVFVSNVGTVYRGEDQCDAEYDFDSYVDLSRRGIGRAGGQDVVLFKDGQTIDQHHAPTES